MNMRHVSSLCRFRSRPLAACFAMALANHIAAADPLASASLSKGAGVVGRPASTLVVQNCADAGPGSLREAVSAANALMDAAKRGDANAMQDAALAFLETQDMKAWVTAALDGK